MYVGYLFGALLKKRFEKAPFMQRVEKWVGEMTGSLGKYGTNMTIMLLGIVNFPYLNTFIASWIGMPMNASFVFTLIGNFIWYLLLWGTVLGLTSFISNPTSSCSSLSSSASYRTSVSALSEMQNIGATRGAPLGKTHTSAIIAPPLTKPMTTRARRQA